MKLTIVNIVGLFKNEKNLASEPACPGGFCIHRIQNMYKMYPMDTWVQLGTKGVQFVLKGTSFILRRMYPRFGPVSVWY